MSGGAPTRRLPPEVVLLAALTALFHAPVLFGGRAYFERDVHFFFHERLAAFHDAVWSGALPLWNPWPAFGEPMLGIANAAIAYPATWLALLLSPPATHTAIVVLHGLLAACGARALARAWGVSRTGALLAGGLWALSGPLQSALSQTNVLIGAAWLPWAWLGFSRGPGGRGLAGVSLGAMLLGGSPEAALMAVAGGAVLALEPDAGPLSRRAGRTAVSLALASALGLALGAVQWLPTLRLAHDSQRGAMSDAYRAFWSNHPVSLSELVLPLHLDALPLAAAARERLFESREPLLASLYVGLAASALALASWAGGARRGRTAFAVLAVAGLVLSLGRFTPLWEVLQSLPPLRLIRFPSRFVLLAVLPLAVLAGFGYDALVERPAGSRPRFALAGLATALLAAAAVVLALTPSRPWRALLEPAASLGHAWRDDPEIQALASRLLLAAVLAVPVLLALVLRARGRPRPLLAGLGALAAVIDVAQAGRGLNPAAALAVFTQPVPTFAALPRVRPNRVDVLGYSPGGPGWRLPADAPPEAKLALRRAYPAGGGAGAALESMPEDVPLLRNVEVARWLASLRRLQATAAFPRLHELSGIDFVTSLEPLGAPDGLKPLGQVALLEKVATTYRVVHALPRALAPTAVDVADGQRAFQRLLDPAFDGTRHVVLPAGRDVDGGEPGRVLGLQLGFDRATVDVEMPAPGHVVLLEAWDPGWRAQVDGVATPVERANLAFRAVAVAAGRHRVAFVYRPPEAAAGAALTLVTLLGLVVVGVRRRAAS